MLCAKFCVTTQNNDVVNLMGSTNNDQGLDMDGGANDVHAVTNQTQSWILESISKTNFDADSIALPTRLLDVRWQDKTDYC